MNDEIRGLAAQRSYARNVHDSGFGFGLVLEEAFVRGLRHIGYRHTGTALDELVDNALEAGAKNIDLYFATANASAEEPEAVAIVDDGHGMEPQMVRLSVIWGGTHREGAHGGLGRFGYGLPSAPLSQGRRVTVMSRPASHRPRVWHGVSIDVDDLGRGLYAAAAGRVEVPPAAPVRIPDWIGRERRGAPEHGTIVIVEKLDHLTWRRRRALRERLIEHFGIVYRNFLDSVRITVDGEAVQPIDPLFLRPMCKYFDLDEDRAEPLEPVRVPVWDQATGVVRGEMRIRYSYLPPTFLSRDKQRDAFARNCNERFRIAADHLGIVFLRNGRQIDVVSRCPWTRFQNNDRYWKVEVDFAGSLDSEFAITTSKQRVEVSDRIWEALQGAGVPMAISQMRRKYEQHRAAALAARVREAEPGSAEWAMAASRVTRSRHRRLQRGGVGGTQRRSLEDVARRYALGHDIGLAQAIDIVRRRAELKPFSVETADVPGDTFYWAEDLGGQRRLVLNRAHPFFGQAFGGSGADPRTALELLLCVLADCELTANEASTDLYECERERWSQHLAFACMSLHVGQER